MPRVSVSPPPRVGLPQVLRGLLVIAGLVLLVLQIVRLTSTTTPRGLGPPLPTVVAGE